MERERGEREGREQYQKERVRKRDNNKESERVILREK